MVMILSCAFIMTTNAKIFAMKIEHPHSTFYNIPLQLLLLLSLDILMALKKKISISSCNTDMALQCYDETVTINQRGGNGKKASNGICRRMIEANYIDEGRRFENPVYMA